MAELCEALESLDRDETVRCLILTGNEKSFAAGADIRELVGTGPIEIMQKNTVALWARVQAIGKPLIAAVSGYALGGGCELALACDIIVASEDARFGQPEINIGVIPGAGGTQRLARILGKYKAMELVLTGRTITAREALQMGLVNTSSFRWILPGRGQETSDRDQSKVTISRQAGQGSDSQGSGM